MLPYLSKLLCLSTLCRFASIMRPQFLHQCGPLDKVELSCYRIEDGIGIVIQKSRVIEKDLSICLMSVWSMLKIYEGKRRWSFQKLYPRIFVGIYVEYKAAVYDFCSW